MAEQMKLVDVVIEIVDARLPQSSRNPLIHDLLGDKPCVLVMAKADLAEEAYTAAWVSNFRKQGLVAVACDFIGGNLKNEIAAVTEGIRLQARGTLEKRRNRGIKNMVIRAMITGIPNVGKSTMINLFAGRAITETADRPGVTRGKQWIRLARDLEMLDMPGILWPNLENREGARKLAVTGAIGDNAYDQEDLALWLIHWLRLQKPGRLLARYGSSEADEDYQRGNNASNIASEMGSAMTRLSCDDNIDLLDEKAQATDGNGIDYATYTNQMILEAIGKRRGLLRKGGFVETEKAAVILLDELRGGRLGPITFDDPADSFS